MSDSQHRAAAGLGQSTPLVTISSLGSISHGVAVPAGDNHPLAAADPVEPSARLDPPPATVLPTFAPQATITPHVQEVATPPRHLNPVSQHVAIPTARVFPASVSPTKSLEVLADQFLSEPSFRTEQLGLQPLMRPVPLPHEEALQRLRTLVDRRAWGDVLKISTGILNDSNDPHAQVYATLVEWPANDTATPANTVPPRLQRETVEVLALKCHAWLKLRRYQDLSSEVERWNFVVDNDATAKSPPWLPWSLHILAAQAQHYSDNPTRASDVLHSLLERIPKEEAVWLANVNNALANCYLRQGEWRLALGAFDAIMELIPAACEQEANTRYRDVPDKRPIVSVLKTAYACEILSRQGRVFMQIGALRSAEERFYLAKMDWINMGQSVNVPELSNLRILMIIPPMLDVNQGLLHFANGSYEQALGCFKSATDHLRSQGSLTPQYDADDWLGPTIAGAESHHALFSECINNMGLCALYTCRMIEAVQLMEGLVREDPTAFLTERLAFNLCTLYELGYDSAASSRKKRILQLIGKRFFLHDVGPESFRVG